MRALAGIRTQADDGDDVLHVPAFPQHHDRHDGLVGAGGIVDLAARLAELVQLFLALAGRCLGNLAVVLGVDDKHRVFQLGVTALQIFGHLVAIAGVVGHHEQDRFLAGWQQLLVDLLPFEIAEMQIILVLLGEFGTFLLVELGPRGAVRQHGRFHDALADGFHQRVIAHGLDEDRPVAVLGGCRQIELGRELRSLLPQAKRDVLDGFEPGTLLVMQVMGLVVEQDEIGHLADDHGEIDLAVGRLADRLLAKEIARCVRVVETRLVSGFVDAVDVGQEEIALGGDQPDLILNMHRELEIVLPVAALVAVGRKDRVLIEDAGTVKIGAQAVEHDDVGCDQQEVGGKVGIRLHRACGNRPRP